jgi:GNAT superfamily N-acetyltransferase
MHVTEVTTSRDRKDFVNFPKKLYRNDPFWVCPLDSGIESVFDPAQNQAFRRGEATRWIARDSSGEVSGRIAAFIDRQRSDAEHQPTGGIGFFEVTDNRDLAFLLFDTAREWLESRGMKAMDGPINFGENDNNWGLLVDGFVQQGYGMPYNMKYYRNFFEEYGFLNYFEQYSFHREVRGHEDKVTVFPERIMRIAEWISKRPGYEFRHFEIARSRRYVDDIAEIYNSTWSVFKEDFTPIDPALLNESLKKAKPIIDEELIWFAYHNGKPIAFFVIMPDFNQILKYFNGRMNPWNMIRFLWFRATHKMTRARALVGGVHPSYQNNGVESAIFLHIYKSFAKKPWYRELELSWVGDYNPRMLAIYEALGASRAKTHITYRYMIDKVIPFKRYKDEMAEKQHIRD